MSERRLPGGTQADYEEFDRKNNLYNSLWDSDDVSEHECGTTCTHIDMLSRPDSDYQWCYDMDQGIESGCLDDCTALSSDKREAMDVALADCGLGTPRIPHIRPTHTFLIEVKCG